MTKRLTACCLVMAALFLLAGIFAPPSEAAAPQKVKFQIQTPYPTSYPYVQRVMKMWQRIKAVTGGQVEVAFFPPGGIVPAYSEWDAMQKGTLDGAFTVPSDVRGVFGPLGDLFNQYPGGPASEEMMAWVYFGNGKAMLQELIESKGFSNVQVVGIANLALAEDELWAKKRIEKPEDYKGLKIRTYGQWGKVLESVGASVVTLPGGEVYQAMERGVIDACELGTSVDNESLHINEVAKFCYYPGVHSPGNVHYIFFNKKSWAKLSPEYQQLIEREILSTAFENYLAGAVDNAAARDRMRAKGTTFLQLPMNVQKFLVEKTDAMWNDVASKDAAFAKVYKDQSAFLAKHRALIGEIQPNLPAIRGTKQLFSTGTRTPLWSPSGGTVVNSTNPTDMAWARGVVRACDRASEWTGRIASWLVWPLMITITYEVICRYALNAPTVWAYDMAYMIGGSMMALGMGYVLQERGHVRVDVLYDLFPLRLRQLLDLTFTAVFFFPIAASFAYLSWQYALLSWARGERSGYGIWEPTLIPFRSVVFVAWTILLLAGIAWFIRTLVAFVRGKDL